MLMMFFNMYPTESRHVDWTDISDLIYVLKSKAPMVTVTKTNLSLVKQEFKRKGLVGLKSNAKCFSEATLHRCSKEQV